jgi:hypothetical protein
VTAGLDFAALAEHYASLGIVALDPAKHPCDVHGTHRPEPLVIIRHHIVPLGMAGPDVPENWLNVCDTGHRNIHTLLGPMCQKDKPTYGILPAVHAARLEKHFAREGFERWEKMGCPGNSHAAYALAKAA